MNLKNFDLNLLVALDVLLSERNVTRAAERLNVTQPTMSNALQRIRDYFGDDILSRSGRELKLTPLAEDLVERVRDLLLQASSILEVDWVFTPATAVRTFRIVMSDYCAALVMPPLIRRLAEAAPNIVCEVVPLTGTMMDDVVVGKVDLCITAQDPELMNPSCGWDLITRQELFQDRWVCVVSDGQMEIAGDLTLEQFCRSPHIVVRFGETTISIEERILRQLGIKMRISVVVGTIALLPAILPGTTLIATLQERLARVVCRSGELRMHPAPVHIPNLIEMMLWHRRSDRDKAHTWLRMLISDITKMLDPVPDAP